MDVPDFEICRHVGDVQEEDRMTGKNYGLFLEGRRSLDTMLVGQLPRRGPGLWGGPLVAGLDELVLVGLAV